MRKVMLLIVGVAALLVPTPARAQDDPWVEFRPVKALYLLNMAENFLYNEFPEAAAEACDQDRPARDARAQQGTPTEGDATCNKAVTVLADIISIWSGGTAAPVDAVAAWCNAAEVETAAKPFVLAWIDYERSRMGTEPLMRRSARETMTRDGLSVLNSPFSFVIVMVAESVGTVETNYGPWHLK